MHTAATVLGESQPGRGCRNARLGESQLGMNCQNARLGESQPGMKCQSAHVLGESQLGNYKIVQGRRAAPGGRMQDCVDPVALVNRYAPISDPHVIDDGR